MLAVGKREDGGRRPGHQQHVGDVAADHVPQHQARIPADRRLHHDHELGERGSESHDGEGDHDRRDMEAPRQRDSPPDEEVPTSQKVDETASQLDEVGSLHQAFRGSSISRAIA